MAIVINSGTYKGLDGIIVKVEVDIARALPSFNIVGLPNVSIKEARERVRSAIVNSHFEFPLGRITINLAPGDIKKYGTFFDLPMALGIICASNQVLNNNIDDLMVIGELSLNGEIKGVNGILILLMEGVKKGFKNFIIPVENLNEATSIEGINIYPFSHLKEAISFVSYRDIMPYKRNIKKIYYNEEKIVDFSNIIGHKTSKRALEISAAGGHSLILYGEPGVGKTLLASSITGILPRLSYDEALEVTKIYSVSGLLRNDDGIVYKRPFRVASPTSTAISLVGGGKEVKVGEATLAHNGVLYLDELLEFKKETIEALRQPLEEKKVTISRLNYNSEFPANFIFLASMNPCECGFRLSNNPHKICTCTEQEKRRYLSRLSGPILDRIDMFNFMNSLSYDEIKEKGNEEPSKIVRERVELARKIQIERFKNVNLHSNSEMRVNHINEFIKINSECSRIIEKIYDKYGISTRVYHRILRLARTIADLDGEKDINKNHIIEAVQYRKFINSEVI